MSYQSKARCWLYGFGLLIVLVCAALVWTGELPRPAPQYRVQLYDGGQVVHEWISSDIQVGRGTFWFTDDFTGQSVTVSGNVLVTRIGEAK